MLSDDLWIKISAKSSYFQRIALAYMLLAISGCHGYWAGAEDWGDIATYGLHPWLVFQPEAAQFLLTIAASCYVWQPFLLWVAFNRFICPLGWAQPTSVPSSSLQHLWKWGNQLTWEDSSTVLPLVCQWRLLSEQLNFNVKLSCCSFQYHQNLFYTLKAGV